MLRFGIHVPLNCVFCNSLVESFDHLFFSCSITKAIWQKLLLCLGLQRSIGDWQERKLIEMRSSAVYLLLWLHLSGKRGMASGFKEVFISVTGCAARLQYISTYTAEYISNRQCSKSLKKLDLYDCKQLRRTPNFNGSRSLETLLFKGDTGPQVNRNLDRVIDLWIFRATYAS
ncbi:uncharacterized protein LOC132050402 [Lycium ferocissimum]|uniref:uncharacterized protein LOC132050402 n=1 Tax=Lycium ferocissimum TaxID=112874 RepID=UPI002814F02D|nr:uncharacterized protein LOC132050402 [Lycium ferocissimum]